MENDALMADLNRWARDARIHPDVFECPYYSECDASVNGTLRGGETCMMSYVGRYYGSNVTGEPFRLVVVGIDHGEYKGATFEERRAGIEEYQSGDCNFNSHYKGVVRTAAAVFGRTGAYCWQMCTSSCQKSRAPSASQCVIDRIAQPNLVKCAPSDTKNRTSRATPKMMANCAHHLINELKLLRPNVVVFHGVAARWFILPKLERSGLHVNAIGGIGDNHGPVLYESQSMGAHLLFLYHPSRRWLDRQWEAVVVPALNYLRGRNLIPA